MRGIGEEEDAGTKPWTRSVLCRDAGLRLLFLSMMPPVQLAAL